MSSTTLIPSSAGSTVIVTVTAVVTPAPLPPIFTQNFYGLLSGIDALIFLLGVWTALIIGLSRFSIFPVFLPFCAALANGICVYTLYPFHHPDLKLPVILVAYVFWTAQNLGAPYYNYFMLRTLLAGRETERRVFTISFNTLMCCTLLVRFPQTYFMAANHNDRTNYIHFVLMKTYFSLLAATETLSAAFLLRTLHRAMRISRRQSRDSRGRKREGLLRQLARSSEVRLATLAGVGIMRAVAWGWTIQWPSGTTIAYGFDDFAVITENVYPMLLIVDLFAARLKGGALDRNSQYTRGETRRRTAPPVLRSGPRMQGVDEEAGDIQMDDMRQRKGSARSISRRFSKLVGRKRPAEIGARDSNREDHSIITVNVASLNCSQAGSSNAGSRFESSSNISVGGDMERFRSGSYATV